MKNVVQTLLAAGVGLTLGWACGQQVCRRKNAEAMVVDLRRHVPSAATIDKAQDRQLKEMRSVLNDAHKHILAVSKGLQKPAL